MSNPARSSAPAADTADAGELLSRLADGDCDAHQAQAACARWSADVQARDAWHRYHLIGDVLRSQELASTASRDASFLADLRTKLAAEPAILAPMALTEAKRRTPRWLVPAAAAAGFVAVIGTLAVLRLQGSAHPAEPILALATPQPARAIAANAANTDAVMIRDARLDIYLQAHRDMRVHAVSAMPGSGLRNVDLLLAPR